VGFKCFLKEKILTLQPVNTATLWAHFICSHLSYSCLPEAWMHYGMLRLPQMYCYPQLTCPDLCKNPVKSDKSVQFWHLLMCLLFSNFSPKLSALLTPIQAGMISQRSVLLHWHGGSLHTVINCSVAYGGRRLEIHVWHLLETTLHFPSDFYSKLSH